MTGCRMEGRLAPAWIEPVIPWEGVLVFRRGISPLFAPYLSIPPGILHPAFKGGLAGSLSGKQESVKDVVGTRLTHLPLVP